MDSKGNITSHLVGLFSRTTKLIQNGLKLAFVFDGKPPKLKEKEWYGVWVDISHIGEPQWIERLAYVSTKYFKGWLPYAFMKTLEEVMAAPGDTDDILEAIERIKIKK